MSGGLTSFELRNVPLLSRVGADRADALRTDIDSAVAGWADAVLLRVDSRNQVLISDGRVVLGKATELGNKPAGARGVPRPVEGRQACLGGAQRAGGARRSRHAKRRCSTLRRAGNIFDDVSAQLVATATALLELA